MAKRRDFGNIKLLNWRPTVDQKKKLKVWLAEEHDWVELLYQMITSGIKLSASHSAEHETFYVTMTCREPTSPNMNKALSVRHGDIQRALGALVWLSVTLPQADWQDLADEQEDDW